MTARAAAAAVVVTAVCLTGAPARAASIRQVTTTGIDGRDCIATPCRTIGYAVSQSVAGDTIAVGAGTFTENITIDRSLTVQGAGVHATILDGGAAGRTVTVTSSVTAVLQKLSIQNGKATDAGGGVLVNGASVTLSSCKISANQVVGNAFGGGIAVLSGSLTVKGCTITANSASASGGASSGNTAGGGGIYAQASPLTIASSTISSNTATGAAGPSSGATGGNAYGAGIYSYGLSDPSAKVSIARSTIAGNVSTGGAGNGAAAGGAAVGGGLSLDLDPASSAVVTNATIAGNRAISGAGTGSFSALGGGVLARSGPLSVKSTTIADNEVDAAAGGFTSGGGGIAALNDPSGSFGTVRVSSTLLARNLRDGTVSSTSACAVLASGVITSGGFNVFDTGCTATGASDQSGTPAAPLSVGLGTLQANGGPAPTMALSPGSPALDHASAKTCPATDERGVSRPQGPGCDVGAFELVPA
jgi:hypothetical protein